MTTRGQKRTNDATTLNTSENGAILNMLVSNQTDLMEVEAETSPAIAKDVLRANDDSPATAKDILKVTQTSTVPALAKETG